MNHMKEQIQQIEHSKLQIFGETPCGRTTRPDLERPAPSTPPLDHVPHGPPRWSPAKAGTKWPKATALSGAPRSLDGEDREPTMSSPTQKN